MCIYNFIYIQIVHIHVSIGKIDVQPRSSKIREPELHPV